MNAPFAITIITTVAAATTVLATRFAFTRYGTAPNGQF